MYKNNRTKKIGGMLSLIILGVLILSSCAPAAAPTAAPAPTQDVAAVQTQSAATNLCGSDSRRPHCGAAAPRTHSGSKHPGGDFADPRCR